MGAWEAANVLDRLEKWGFDSPRYEEGYEIENDHEEHHGCRWRKLEPQLLWEGRCTRPNTGPLEEQLVHCTARSKHKHKKKHIFTELTMVGVECKEIQP